MDIGELSELLGRAYWVETTLEGAGQWAAFMELEEQREVLFDICRDSRVHKETLEHLSNNLLGVDVIRESASLRKAPAGFGSDSDKITLSDLMRLERMALDLYCKILELTDPELIKEKWQGQNPKEYFEKLEWLVLQEEGHIELINSLSAVDDDDFRIHPIA